MFKRETRKAGRTTNEIAFGTFHGYGFSGMNNTVVLTRNTILTK